MVMGCPWKGIDRRLRDSSEVQTESRSFCMPKVLQKPKREICAHQLQNSWPKLSLSLAWMKVYYSSRSQYCSQKPACLKSCLAWFFLPCPWRGYQRSLERWQCCGHALWNPPEQSHPGSESSKTVIIWHKTYKMGVVAESIYDTMPS